MPVVDQERMGLYIVDLDNQIVEPVQGSTKT